MGGTAHCAPAGFDSRQGLFCLRKEREFGTLEKAERAWVH